MVMVTCPTIPSQSDTLQVKSPILVIIGCLEFFLGIVSLTE